MRWWSFEAFTVFVGCLFILLGVSLIIKAFWHIDLPLFRIGISLFLIYLGLGLIFQPPWHWQGRERIFRDGSERSWVFSSARAQLEEGASDFNAIFSSVEVDLSSLKPGEKRTIECNAVFGSMKVLLPRDVPVRVEGNAVFGGVVLPDKKNVSFGSISSEQASDITIVANAVFGSVEFQVK